MRRLRADGHRIRFVSNTTTRSRAQIGDQLRLMGIEVEDDELQTTGAVAARVLKDKRVLALTMPGLLDDLEGLQLVGMNVDAVLLGGADEGEETGRVFGGQSLDLAEFSRYGPAADLAGRGSSDGDLDDTLRRRVGRLATRARPLGWPARPLSVPRLLSAGAAR